MLALSLCGHVAICVLLLLRIHQPLQAVPAPEISVSLVEETPRVSIRAVEPMMAQPPAKTSVAGDISAEPSPSAAPSKPKLRPTNSLHLAQQLYALTVLSRPENTQAQKALPTLAPDERRIQLCNIEAMEQLRRTETISAEMVAPCAFQDLVIHAAEIVADGAAVRAGDHWLRLRYRCVIDPTAPAPSDFAFALGDDIPKAEWSDHFLVAGSPGD
jgi:hypothetical protein